MNGKKTILTLLIGLGLISGTIQKAAADEWDQKTIFTFSGPVVGAVEVTTMGRRADTNSTRITNRRHYGRRGIECTRANFAAGRPSGWYSRRMGWQ
jgi:hypothetical protein